MYIYVYIYTANIYDNMTCEQSRKLQVHGKDIHKFGKVPSLATCLHKMMYMANVWHTCNKLAGYRSKEDKTYVDRYFPSFEGVC